MIRAPLAFIWSAANKDVRRRLADPLTLLLWLGIPLVIGSLITLATGGSDGPSPRAHLLVADQDDSFVSGLLAGTFGQGQLGGLIDAEPVTLEDGRARIDAGDGSALLVIPAGFGDALLREQPAVLELVKNPSQRILPGIIEEGLEILVDGSFYVHRILGSELQTILAQVDADAPPSDADIAGVSVSVNQAVRRVERFLMPPAIELETVVNTPAEEGPQRSAPFSLYFLPGILFMALMFMAQGVSEDIWHERDHGTLRRALAAPHSIAAFLAGKVLAATILMGAITLFGLALGFAYHGLPWRGLPLATLWSTITGAVLLLAMLCLQTLASSARSGSILTNSILFPLLMIGGSFFPSEAMPEFMAAIGRRTPNGYAVEQLKDMLLDRIDLGALATASLVLMASGLLFFGLCTRRLRGTFAQGVS